MPAARQLPRQVPVGTWFLNLADAQRKCERRLRDYHDIRPHSAVGYETPSALAKRSPATSPPLAEQTESSGSAWSRNGSSSNEPAVSARGGPKTEASQCKRTSVMSEYLPGVIAL